MRLTAKIIKVAKALIFGDTPMRTLENTIIGKVVELGPETKLEITKVSNDKVNEFRERVKRHQADRGLEWTNIEEEKHLSNHSLHGRVVVIDCVTLWCTNFFFDNDSHVESSLTDLKAEFDRLITQEATLIFVTNEIGLGGISPDPIQRKFTDLQGWFNQYIAQKADKVVLMVSGLPLIIKS